MKKITFILFTFSYFSTFGQHNLEKSKYELKSKPASISSGTTSSSSKSSKVNVPSEEEINLLLTAIVYTTSGVYYAAFGIYEEEQHLNNPLTPYPYYDGKSGNYENQDSIPKYISRFSIEDHFLYNSNNLYGNHLKVKIQPFQYFYFQTDYHELLELDEIENTNDHLSLFDFNFCYDRIRFEKFNFGWTMGASYVGNDVNKAGFSLGLNTEYFMNNHVSFLGAAKWGWINTHPVNSYELQAKFHRKKHYFSFGIEHLKIATPTYTFVGLGGGIYF